MELELKGRSCIRNTIRNRSRSISKRGRWIKETSFIEVPQRIGPQGRSNDSSRSAIELASLRTLDIGKKPVADRLALHQERRRDGIATYKGPVSTFGANSRDQKTTFQQRPSLVGHPRSGASFGSNVCLSMHFVGLVTIR